MTVFAPTLSRTRAAAKPVAGTLARARLDDVHMARGVALMLIVLTHVATMLGAAGGVTGELVGAALFDISAAFVLISGYLFQYLSADFSYPSYLWRKFKYVIVPYVIFSLIPITIYLLRIKSHPWLPEAFLAEHNPAYLIGYFLLTGQHLGPLWFMPMIALFYIAAPVFIWIDRDPKRYWLLVPLLVVSALVTRSVHNDNPLAAFAHFGSAYVVGMAMSRWRAELTPILTRHFYLLCGIAFAGLVACVTVRVPGGVALLLKLPLAMAIITVFDRFPRLRPHWLSTIATLSFGIYFTHAAIVSIGRMLVVHLGERLPHGAYMIPIAYAGVLFGALALVWGAQHVLGKRSRFVVGV